MDHVKGNSGKKNFLVKTWKRCRSFPGGGSGGCLSKTAKEKNKVAAQGFFPVYVGQEKQRFAIKTKYVNHPMFMMLLEDAKTEYGYNSDGPILLPCEVDLFYKVLAEMDTREAKPYEFGFAYGSCSPFNPSRRLGVNGANEMAKGYGSYGLLTPSRLIKMN